MIRVGDQAWLNTGGTWSELPIGQGEDLMAGLFTPAKVWSALLVDLPATAALAGEEQVNGIRAQHFRSTSQAWGSLALASRGRLTQANDDVWIAADGRFPVRAVFQPWVKTPPARLCR